MKNFLSSSSGSVSQTAAFLAVSFMLWTGMARAATVQTFYPATTPSSGLLAAPDGNFYGTSFYGGDNDLGTVFKLSSTGVYQLLYSFPGGTYGANPCAALVLGPDGFMYGTSQYAGNQNAGTVFRFSPAGAFTLYRDLVPATDGAEPTAGLVVGTNKLLYGTASSGGSSGCGTIFSIATDTTFTLRYTFSGPDGKSPAAALTAGADGLLYGVTQYGGASGYGTIFRITTGGVLTSLFSFKGTNGAYPAAALVQGPDGAFYGVTGYGGTNGFGTIFKITTAGAFTTLYNFTKENLGSNPSGGLAFDPDFNLYGCASYGGTNGFGSLFKITTAGAFASVYDFKGNNDGANPVTPLARNGYSFYGGTSSGGTSYGGTVFQLTLLHFDPSQILPGRKVRFSGSGGVSNGLYAIFTTTNGGPRATWTSNGNGHFDAAGLFSFTNTLSLEAKRFYFLQQLP